MATFGLWAGLLLAAVVLVVKRRDCQDVLVDLTGGSIVIGWILFLRGYGSFIVPPIVAFYLPSAFIFFSAVLYGVNRIMVQRRTPQMDEKQLIKQLKLSKK